VHASNLMSSPPVKSVATGVGIEIQPTQAKNAAQKTGE